MTTWNQTQALQPIASNFIDLAILLIALMQNFQIYFTKDKHTHLTFDGKFQGINIQ